MKNLDRKKIIVFSSLLGLSLTFIFVIYYRFFRRQPKLVDDLPNVGTPVIQDYEPDNIIYKDEKIEQFLIFNINESDFNVPSELPVYKINENLPYQKVENLVQKLDFVEQPERFDDALLGATYLWWNDNGDSFRYVPSSSVLEYKTDFPKESLGFELTEDQLLNLAADHINKYRLRDFISPVTISFKEIEYIESGIEHIQTVDRQKANMAVIKYEMLVDNYVVTSSTLRIGSFSLFVSKDGNLISFYIDAIGDLEKIGNYKLMNFEQTKSNSHLASIQSYENDSIDPTEISESYIKQIIVNNIDYIYLQEFRDSQVFLQPVYVLSGIAQTFGDGTLQVKLYLPALSDILY